MAGDVLPVTMFVWTCAFKLIQKWSIVDQKYNKFVMVSKSVGHLGYALNHYTCDK